MLLVYEAFVLPSRLLSLTQPPPASADAALCAGLDDPCWFKTEQTLFFSTSSVTYAVEAAVEADQEKDRERKRKTCNAHR